MGDAFRQRRLLRILVSVRTRAFLKGLTMLLLFPAWIGAFALTLSGSLREIPTCIDTLVTAIRGDGAP